MVQHHPIRFDLMSASDIYQIPSQQAYWPLIGKTLGQEKIRDTNTSENYMTQPGHSFFIFVEES